MTYMSQLKKYYEESNGKLCPISTRITHFLSNKYFPNKNTKIVDVGIGTGQQSIPLFLNGYKNITGIDKENNMFPELKEKGMKEGIILNLEKNNHSYLTKKNITNFDVALSFGVLEHIFNYDNYMKNIYSMLKINGLFICATEQIQSWWHTENFYDDPTHIKPYTKSGLKRLFEMHGFEVILIANKGTYPLFGITKLYLLHSSLMFKGQGIMCIGKKMR